MRQTKSPAPIQYPGKGVFLLKKSRQTSLACWEPTFHNANVAKVQGKRVGNSSLVDDHFIWTQEESLDLRRPWLLPDQSFLVISPPLKVKGHQQAHGSTENKPHVPRTCSRWHTVALSSPLPPTSWQKHQPSMWKYLYTQCVLYKYFSQVFCSFLRLGD